MAQIRVEWTETWTAPGETSAETSFRLVEATNDGTQWTIERAYTDAAGGTSWKIVTALNDSSTLPAELSSAALSQNVLAAMLAVIFQRRRF